MRVIPLLSKKAFRAPALFVNPQAIADAKALHLAIQRYPRGHDEEGVEQIDGTVVYLRDWMSLSNILCRPIAQPLIGARKSSLTERVLMIDPGLDFLLRGSGSDRRKMMRTKLFDLELFKELRDIEELGESPVTKSRLVTERAYPRIHAGTISKLIKFQLDNGADILIAPSVPLTSSNNFENQIDKSISMFKEVRHLLDTMFNAYSGKIDVMNLLSVSAPLISERDHFLPIINALLETECQHVGLKITNLDTNNENQIQSIFDLVMELEEAIRGRELSMPVHVMNMDHLGYCAFCYGAVSLTMPIARDPYFTGMRHRKDYSPSKKGVYYHPSMRYLTYDNLSKETRPMGYRLPCPCAACQQYETIIKVEKYTTFNRFRRIHEVLYRNLENKMLREVTIPFDEALRDMFGRHRVEWTHYLPASPIIAF